MNTLPPFVCLTERGGYDTDEEDAIAEWNRTVVAKLNEIGHKGAEIFGITDE